MTQRKWLVNHAKNAIETSWTTRKKMRRLPKVS